MVGDIGFYSITVSTSIFNMIFADFGVGLEIKGKGDWGPAYLSEMRDGLARFVVRIIAQC